MLQKILFLDLNFLFPNILADEMLNVRLLTFDCILKMFMEIKLTFI